MFHNIEQNTDEWLALRAGKLTGSSIAKVMANYGKAFGEPAKKLAVDIAIEQVTGKPVSGGFTNGHMERGHDEEPIALELYEQSKFVIVENGGFYDNGDTGCSPDGRPPGGLIEIKSAIPSAHYARIKRGSLDPTYRWQSLFNMRESGSEWIDFISYCSTFTPDKKLFVYRAYAADYKTEYDQIADRVAEFMALVTVIKSDLEA